MMGAATGQLAGPLPRVFRTTKRERVLDDIRPAADLRPRRQKREAFDLERRACKRAELLQRARHRLGPRALESRQRHMGLERVLLGLEARAAGGTIVGAGQRIEPWVLRHTSPERARLLPAEGTEARQ